MAKVRVSILQEALEKANKDLIEVEENKRTMLAQAQQMLVKTEGLKAKVGTFNNSWTR